MSVQLVPGETLKYGDVIQTPYGPGRVVRATPDEFQQIASQLFADCDVKPSIVIMPPGWGMVR